LAAIVPLSRNISSVVPRSVPQKLHLLPVTVVKEKVFISEKSCNRRSMKIESIPVSALVKRMFQSGEKL
jgi:hypothetical protein